MQNLKETEPGRPTCRRDNNIKLNLKEIGWEGVNWLQPAQDKGPCEHTIEPWVPSTVGNFLSTEEFTGV